MDRNDFGQIMAVLINAFPSTREVPKRVLDVYYQFLKGQDRSTLAEASVVAITEETFFPSIAKLLEICRELSGTSPPNPELAWDFALACASNGAWGELTHPAIVEAGKVLGPLNNLRTSDRAANRSRFLDAYGGAVRRYWRQQQIAAMPLRIAE